MNIIEYDTFTERKNNIEGHEVLIGGYYEYKTSAIIKALEEITGYSVLATTVREQNRGDYRFIQFSTKNKVSNKNRERVCYFDKGLMV